jgi:hypothetical protein
MRSVSKEEAEAALSELFDGIWMTEVQSHEPLAQGSGDDS